MRGYYPKYKQNRYYNMGNKRKLKKSDNEFEFDPVPKHLVVAHLKNQEKRLIIILEGAQLETVKVPLYYLFFVIAFKV